MNQVQSKVLASLSALNTVISRVNAIRPGAGTIRQRVLAGATVRPGPTELPTVLLGTKADYL
jgi:hypothetical protein